MARAETERARSAKICLPVGRITSLYRTVADGSEALGALAGGVFAAIAGIRVTMLIGALPIAAAMVVLSWHHRGAPANS
jgi:predicted MFS family arabinose efflux permease